MRYFTMHYEPIPSRQTDMNTYMYHGSTSGLREILPCDGSPGNIFGGVFASVDRESAASHGGTVYEAEVADADILTQSALNYEVDNENVLAALRMAMPRLADEDVETAYRAVVEDHADEVDANDLLRVFNADDAGVARWEAQRIRGEVAATLGYKAVEMSDEHGTSYLLLPGVQLTLV